MTSNLVALQYLPDVTSVSELPMSTSCNHCTLIGYVIPLRIEEG